MTQKRAQGKRKAFHNEVGPKIVLGEPLRLPTTFDGVIGNVYGCIDEDWNDILYKNPKQHKIQIHCLKLLNRKLSGSKPK